MEINTNHEKRCGFCGEIIADDLSRCPYCGSLLYIGPYAPAEDNNVKDENSFGVTDEIGKEILDITPHLAEENTDNKEIEGDDKAEDISKATGGRSSLGNGLKVFLTVISTIIPGIGQLFGIITGIILMNSEDEERGADKRSFGIALVVSSLIMFVLSGISWFILLLALAVPFNS